MKILNTKYTYKSIITSLFFFLVISLSLFDLKAIPGSKLLADFTDFNIVHKAELCYEKAGFLPNYYDKKNQCADNVSRVWLYPPPMFLLFKWTTLFEDKPIVLKLYRIFSVLSLLICWLIWAKEKKDPLGIIFLLLSLWQFPNVFALSRGNNDFLVVLLWSFSYYFYAKEKYKTSGFLAGFCVVIKIYPIIPLFFLIVTFLVRYLWKKAINVEDNNGLALKNFIYGIVLIFVFQIFLFDLWAYYLLEIIPNWASRTLGFMTYSHSLKSFRSNFLILIFYALSFISFIKLSFSIHRKDVRILFVAPLALSTFAQGISYDYNLITIYPLLWVLYERKNWRNSYKQTFYFTAICAIIFGTRLIVEDSIFLLKLRTFLIPTLCLFIIYIQGDNSIWKHMRRATRLLAKS